MKTHARGLFIFPRYYFANQTIQKSLTNTYEKKTSIHFMIKNAQTFTKFFTA